MMKLIFIYLTLLVSSVAFCDDEYTDLLKATILATQADVNISSVSSGNKLTIKVDKSRSVGGCKYQVDRKGKELFIDAVQTVEGLSCPMEFTVVMPVSLHFDVTLNRGNIKMNGDFTDSIFDVAEGTITVNGKGSALQVKNKKGSFDFKGVLPLLAIDVEEGPISIEYIELSRSGVTHLDSKKGGDVTITVPRGIEMSGEYSLGLNKADFKFRNGHTFDARLSGGNFRIKR